MLKIKNLLISNKICFNQNDVLFFFKKKYFFKNRKHLQQINSFCAINDCIEVILCKEIFLFNIRIFSFYLKNKIKQKKIKLQNEKQMLLETFFFLNFSKYLLNSFEID